MMSSMLWQLSVGWHLHIIFGGTALVGGILFIIWASKMEKEQLKQWVLWTVIVGILGVLLTGPWGFKGMEYMKGVWHKDGMMNGKMMEMMNKGGGMMNEEMMEMMNNGGMTK